jgi:hypothetical protein
MGARYASASEEALHESAIEALANEMRRPIAEIKQYYEREFSILEDGARLRDFLSVCATRRTREVLRHRADPTTGPTLAQEPARPAVHH